MYLRKRNSNLSIERAIYEPAQKDALGNVIKPAVRTTRYIGSISAYSSFSRVPAELLQQLTESEVFELKEALKGNEPSAFAYLDSVPISLMRATKEISACIDEFGVNNARKMLEKRMKAIDEAWVSFFKTAQDQGLKRRRKALRKPKLTPVGPDI